MQANYISNQEPLRAVAKLIDKVGRAINLSGHKFGYLTVVGRSANAKNGNAMWDCTCECGKAISVIGTDLRNGERVSCGRHRYIDLTGKAFGRLTVIGKDEHKSGNYVFCQCECGEKISAPARKLLSGNTKSCGCLNRDIKAERFKTHGKSRLPEYRIWAAMIQRCNNSNCKHFADYGGRGIKVCDRWRDFENFFSDMGPRPKGYSIERKNNNDGYNPENCVWATREQQQNNRRVNVTAVYNGQKMTLTQIAKATSINISTVRYQYCEKIGIFSELAAMHTDADALESGKRVAAFRLTPEQLAEIHAEPIGYEYSTAPYNW